MQPAVCDCLTHFFTSIGIMQPLQQGIMHGEAAPGIMLTDNAGTPSVLLELATDTGGNTYGQGMRAYVRASCEAKDTQQFRTTPLPAFLVEMQGHYLHISGLAWERHLLCEPLARTCGGRPCGRGRARTARAGSSCAVATSAEHCRRRPHSRRPHAWPTWPSHAPFARAVPWCSTQPHTLLHPVLRDASLGTVASGCQVCAGPQRAAGAGAGAVGRARAGASGGECHEPNTLGRLMHCC